MLLHNILYTRMRVYCNNNKKNDNDDNNNTFWKATAGAHRGRDI